MNAIIELIKFAYEAIVDLFERIEGLEKRVKFLAVAKNPPVVGVIALSSM